MSEQKRVDAEVLFCILKSQHHVEEVLTGFMELGISGASILESKGMAQILTEQVPIFAGFRSLFAGEGSDSQLIVSVIKTDLVEDAIDLIEEICGDFVVPGSGIMFTLPVCRVAGLIRNI
ncbi:MAG: hypothetical protein COA79_03990 [Planctomycetota bacterium]|nr:MAG: hypothetical protein COA79_03990 [Planctomycetota bacterium]